MPPWAELPSNYDIGNHAAGGVVSCHMDRETIEITHGLTPWMEAGLISSTYRRHGPHQLQQAATSPRS